MTPQQKRLIRINLFLWALLFAGYELSRYYQLEWNQSTSMPQRLWLTEVGNKKLKHGDYVVIKFHDPRMTATDDYEYVVKQIAGVTGDAIVVKRSPDQHFSLAESQQSFELQVNDQLFTVYTTLAANHFTPLTAKIIPRGCYFVHGQHQPSFDSRYQEFGLICESQIYGKSRPLF